MSAPEDAALHHMERAVRALTRPGAFIEAVGAGYVVRLGPDRRRRAMLGFDEAAFRALVAGPGLRPRADGGWTLIPARPAPPPPPPGRPGVIEGEREVMDAAGRLRRRRANFGESPLAWLARRKDAEGRPWLSPLEFAAGERLREDVHRCGLVGRLTMDWSAGPRASGGRGMGLDPAERGVAAKARVRAALAAVGPQLVPILERICVTGSALEAAERALGIPKRTGKTVLKLALQRLADHYRMGL